MAYTKYRSTTLCGEISVALLAARSSKKGTRSSRAWRRLMFPDSEIDQNGLGTTMAHFTFWFSLLSINRDSSKFKQQPLSTIHEISTVIQYEQTAISSIHRTLAIAPNLCSYATWLPIATKFQARFGRRLIPQRYAIPQAVSPGTHQTTLSCELVDSTGVRPSHFRKSPWGSPISP